MIQFRTVVALALILLVFFAFWPAEPRPYDYGPQFKNNWQPNTVGQMRASAAFIDRRLDDGNHVFSVMAEYHSLSDHYPPYSPRIYHLVSPQHGQIEGWNRTARHDRMQRRFTHGLRTGEIDMLIMTRRTAYILQRWPAAREAFRAKFCRIQPRPAVYEENNVHVYVYAPEREGCVNRTRFFTTA